MSKVRESALYESNLIEYFYLVHSLHTNVVQSTMKCTSSSAMFEVQNWQTLCSRGVRLCLPHSIHSLGQLILSLAMVVGHYHALCDLSCIISPFSTRTALSPRSLCDLKFDISLNEFYRKKNNLFTLGVFCCLLSLNFSFCLIHPVWKRRYYWVKELC